MSIKTESTERSSDDCKLMNVVFFVMKKYLESKIIEIRMFS